MLFLHCHIFHDVRIMFFCWYVCITYRNNVKIRFRFCSLLWRIFYCVKIMLFICSMFLRFLQTLELRYILVRSNYVWKWRDNYVSVLLVIVTYFLLRYNYVIYFFDVAMFFDDVRNKLYFGTFKLHMEITLQLRSIFVRHCNVFFIMSQLRYLFVRCSYVCWWC